MKRHTTGTTITMALLASGTFVMMGPALPAEVTPQRGALQDEAWQASTMAATAPACPVSRTWTPVPQDMAHRKTPRSMQECVASCSAGYFSRNASSSRGWNA